MLTTHHSRQLLEIKKQDLFLHFNTLQVFVDHWWKCSEEDGRHVDAKEFLLQQDIFHTTQQYDLFFMVCIWFVFDCITLTHTLSLL